MLPVPDRSRYLVRRRRPVASLAGIAALLVLWEAATRLHWVNAFFLPPPSAILLETWAMAASGELWRHVAASLLRMLLGILIGGGLGVATGLAMGFSDLLDAGLSPLINAIYPIPKIALLPLLILWLGIGEPSKVAVLALGTFFPLAINTYTGVRGTDPSLVKAAVAFGAGRLSIVRKVLLPSALPVIFAGLRLATGTALLLLVSAEMLGADRGLGQLILSAGNLMLTTQLMAGVLVISLLGLLFAWLLRRLERWAVPWREP